MCLMKQKQEIEFNLPFYVMIRETFPTFISKCEGVPVGEKLVLS